MGQNLPVSPNISLNHWSLTLCCTDYMFPTTTPVEGEKLSDERLKGRVASLLMELAGLVCFLYNSTSQYPRL